MSEITKLYENCGIEIPIARLKILKDDNGEIFTRPPLTAEKQIELIKFLLKNYEGVDIDKSFEESLAGAINEVWVNMPEEEKQQVKGILE